MQRNEKQDIYTRITNQIISHLERGVMPWVRPCGRRLTLTLGGWYQLY
jgi:antirestriction protein ArdC